MRAARRAAVGPACVAPCSGEGVPLLIWQALLCCSPGGPFASRCRSCCCCCCCACICQHRRACRRQVFTGMGDDALQLQRSGSAGRGAKAREEEEPTPFVRAVVHQHPTSAVVIAHVVPTATAATGQARSSIQLILARICSLLPCPPPPPACALPAAAAAPHASTGSRAPIDDDALGRSRAQRYCTAQRSELA